jgi:hypothetical protein
MGEAPIAPFRIRRQLKTLFDFHQEYQRQSAAVAH